MEKTYQIERLIEVCDHYALAAGMHLNVIASNGTELYATEKTAGICSFCRMLGHVSACKDTVEQEAYREKCRMSRLYGSYQAQRFGGRYIFFCHLGFTLFSSPIVQNGEMQAALVCGPLLMVDVEDFYNEDILPKFEKLRQYGVYEQDAPGDIMELKSALRRVPCVAPEQVHALSEMLYICAGHIAGSACDEMATRHESQKLQSVISEYIKQIKNDKDAKFYPLDKEDELLLAMSVGDIKGAKALLNEILGYIFFYSGFKFEVIRSRILELVVLLSRAALKGGADAELIFGLNYEYLKEIDKFNTIEDLAYWLSIIMNRFTDYVFNFVGVKHADVIYKAIDYIKKNYMKKLTLEEVSNYVYLSPAYFSKVFKKETGQNFNAYMNNIKIEKSKALLLNENINLADISNIVGYEDQSYFSKVFKKMTGMSPLRYRQSRGK